MKAAADLHVVFFALVVTTIACVFVLVLFAHSYGYDWPFRPMIAVTVGNVAAYAAMLRSIARRDARRASREEAPR